MKIYENHENQRTCMTTHTKSLKQNQRTAMTIHENHATR